MLSSFRILDLCNERGSFCGRILADYGADIIKVEPTGGDSSRNLGPFYHDIPDPEKSLHWFFLNANKKGITLNIETAAGREIFLELVKTADVVIESFSVGYLNKIGLDYAALTKVKPDLILTSVSPFGQDGPYSHFKGSDLVCLGMSGMQYLCGEPDRAPVYISFPQAYLNAGTQAATGTLMALFHREQSGEGQHVDISTQGMMAGFHTAGPAVWDMKRVSLKRVGAFRVATSAFLNQRQIWQCKDGYVAFFVAGGKIGARIGGRLVEWMIEEDMAEDFLKELKWEELDLSSVDPEFFDSIQDNVSRFFLKHTKLELYEEASKRGIMLCPTQTIADIAQSPQLAARNFWVDVEHPELDTNITYPGNIIRFSNYNPVVKSRAPLIGEHNMEIFKKELGLSEDKLCILKQNSVI